MTRGSLIALGVPLVVVGLALGTAGTVVAASVGPDDSVSTAPTRLRGTGVAVVADDVRVEESSVPVPDGVGSLTLTVTARDGREMFAGVAAPSDVDRYLTGAPYEVVVDLSSGTEVTTRPVPGSQQPAPPATERFWTTSVSGAPASLSARIAPGATLVVMNADAASGVDADVVVTLKVPHAFAYSVAVAGVGALLVLLGVVLLVRARRARRRTADVPAVPVAWPAPESSAVSTTVLPAAAPGHAVPEAVEGDLVVAESAAASTTVLPAAVPGSAGSEAAQGDVPAADAAVGSTTVLPSVAPENAEAEPAEPDVVTPASAALADLVAAATTSPSDGTARTDQPPVVLVPPLGAEPETRSAPEDGDHSVAEPADPGARTAELGVVATSAGPVVGEGARPVEGGDGPGSAADSDPLFAELVSAYGVDPVHDALTEPTTGPEGGAVPDEPGAPDPAPVGG